MDIFEIKIILMWKEILERTSFRFVLVGAPQYIRYSKSKLSILVSKTFNKSLKIILFLKILLFQHAFVSEIRVENDSISARNVQSSAVYKRNPIKMVSRVRWTPVSRRVHVHVFPKTSCPCYVHFFSSSCPGNCQGLMK